MATAACVGYGLHTARQTVLFSGCCYIHVWETGCIERETDRQRVSFAGCCCTRGKLLQRQKQSHLRATAIMYGK